MGHLVNQPSIKNGFQSLGVTVYFPVSPNLILLIIDSSYLCEIGDRDRRIISIDDVEDVIYFNQSIALNADRCVISQKDNFVDIENLLKDKPNIFDKPKAIINYGGKTYYPRKKK